MNNLLSLMDFLLRGIHFKNKSFPEERVKVSLLSISGHLIKKASTF